MTNIQTVLSCVLVHNPMKDIIRFKFNARKILILRGVTEEQAKEWCSSPLTRKEGVYFDGYSDINSHCVNHTPKYTHYFTPTEEYN